MTKVLKAQRQGAFDKFCSIYSLINTIDFLRGPLTEDQLQEIFDNLINQISNNWSLEAALLEGISSFQLSNLLKRELTDNYQLVFKKPFYRKPKTKINVVWGEVKRWVDCGGVVLSNDGEHWTLITRVTEFRAYLHDSIGIKYISRKELCTSNKKEEQIYPSRLIFIGRREDDLCS